MSGKFRAVQGRIQSVRQNATARVSKAPRIEIDENNEDSLIEAVGSERNID